MGLDTTHDCWHGSYFRFMDFRKVICEVAGLGNLEEYEGYGGNRRFPDRFQESLVILLDHSDCDGIIRWCETRRLAKRLLSLLPNLQDWQQQTKQFAEGLMRAWRRLERVEFH
jgi:hypothetical protein